MHPCASITAAADPVLGSDQLDMAVLSFILRVNGCGNLGSTALISSVEYMLRFPPFLGVTQDPSGIQYPILFIHMLHPAKNARPYHYRQCFRKIQSPEGKFPEKAAGEVPVSPSPSRIKPAVSAAVPLEVRGIPMVK